jgi:hypothetical protein
MNFCDRLEDAQLMSMTYVSTEFWLAGTPMPCVKSWHGFRQNRISLINQSIIGFHGYDQLSVISWPCLERDISEGKLTNHQPSKSLLRAVVSVVSPIPVSLAPAYTQA